MSDAMSELDARIHSEVMGGQLRYLASGTPYDPSKLAAFVNPEVDLIMDGSWQASMIPHYSTDLAAAWLVVEARELRMREPIRA